MEDDLSAVSQHLRGLPWEACIFQCKINPDSEIIILRCLHAICSESCKDKYFAEVRRSESQPKCKVCEMPVDMDNFKKCVPSKIFRLKPKFEDLKIQKCGLCYKERRATSYCADCTIYYCRNCKLSHRDNKNTYNHKNVMSLTMKSKKDLDDINLSESKCKMHGELDTPIKILYCADCCQKLCIKCNAGHDPAHKTHLVEEMLRNFQQKIVTFSSSKQLFDEAISSLQTKRNDFSTGDGKEWKAVKKDIENKFNSIVQAVMQRRDEVLQEAEDKFKMKSNDLAGIQLGLEKTRSKSSLLESLYATFDSRFNDTAVLNLSEISSSLMSTIDNSIYSLTRHFDRKVEKNMSFKMEYESSDEDAINKRVSKLGSIEYRHDGTKATEPGPFASSSSLRADSSSKNAGQNQNPPVLEGRYRIARKSTGGYPMALKFLNRPTQKTLCKDKMDFPLKAIASETPTTSYRSTVAGTNNGIAVLDGSPIVPFQGSQLKDDNPNASKNEPPVAEEEEVEVIGIKRRKCDTNQVDASTIVFNKMTYMLLTDCSSNAKQFKCVNQECPGLLSLHNGVTRLVHSHTCENSRFMEEAVEPGPSQDTSPNSSMTKPIGRQGPRQPPRQKSYVSKNDKQIYYFY